MAVSGKSEAASGSSQVILIIRDVTAHKNAEQDREAARKAFALAEVCAVLAHEIRNPLGSLELLTRCLDEDPGLSGESKQCVEHIQAGVRSLAATVNNVLGFHNPGRTSSCPLDLAALLRSSLEFMRPLAKQHEVDVELHSDMGQTQVKGEKEGLRQVFLNLLCNALHHTPAGGKIEVLSKVEDLQGRRTAVIEFADSGSGIRKEDLPRIFDAGFSTTGSSGLGLAVCRRIIEQHQGRITVHSEFGQGATFRLEIPTL
jgi:two-component system sensor histidine kinase FlrB